MFAHQCTDCQRRELIFADQITNVTNTSHGIIVKFTCWCGAEQTMLSGKTATTAPKVTLAA